MSTTVRFFKQPERMSRTGGETIRELCLAALPSGSDVPVEVDSTLEHGGRIYHVLLKQSVGEVDYVHVRAGGG